MVVPQNFSNVARIYREIGLRAIEAFRGEDFELADRLCVELLEHADLPLVWRAKANFLLATCESNAAEAYATDAIAAYEEILQTSTEDPSLSKELEQAKHALEDAKQRRSGEQELESAVSYAEHPEASGDPQRTHADIANERLGMYGAEAQQDSTDTT